MSRPIPFSDAHFRAADKFLARGKLGELHFSEGTYQIEVRDAKSKESFWPFLQLDDEGRLLDSFCTCGLSEKSGSCLHLAIAYRVIFRNYEVPLHVRFRASLWTVLCQIASRRSGYKSDALEKRGQNYLLRSQTRKELFSVRGMTPSGKKRLHEILFERPEATEETSIKFSNLPTEELQLWKQGRASDALLYELSFFSDLAKWWMCLQEEGAPYQIRFLPEGGMGLPKQIQILFPSVEATFYIAEVNWEQLILALKTVHSPLAVFEFGDKRVKQIVYSPQKRQFQIEFLETQLKGAAPTEGISVGEWRYVPQVGFYPKQLDPIFQEEMIQEARITALLKKHSSFIQHYLVGTKIHSGTIKARYHLFFDPQEQFHIQCYLFEPGDLQRPLSACFGSWVYLEELGFYQIENLLFEGIEKVIHKSHLSDFINRHRHFLHQHEGFQVHVSLLASRLFYTLDAGGLHFGARLDLEDEEGISHIDCGDWIYVPGRGFYAKLTGRVTQLIKAGMSVSLEGVPLFIQLHREELEQISHFFAEQTPLARSGLDLLLTEDEQIVVRPVYQFKEGYADKQVQFLGHYTYVDKEGFALIPHDLRLPEKYTKEVVVPTGDHSYFIGVELEALKGFILSLDPRLKSAKTLELQIHQITREDKGHWSLKLVYQTELGRVPLEEVFRAVHDKRPYLFTAAGLLALHQPRFNWLKGIPKKRLLGEGEIRLTTLEWMRLSLLEEIIEPKQEESRRLLEEFRNLSTREKFELTGLKSTLRPYQETGVRWLWFIYVNGLSCLLCDEMGLGKTHQAMALIAAVAHPSSHFLVVCPTSVIFHWEELLKQFLPTLRICVFYGIQRSLDEFQQHYDLLLTSYGTLRSERVPISKIPFEVAIFDEMQIAKNIHSQTHQALRLVDAKMKLGLTGTPIENRLLELKALFDLILPSYLPNEAQFKELFVNPIEKQQDVEKKRLLAKLIRPFLLRRKKSEVLLELPEKTEEIAYCLLSDEQQELYRATYLGAQKKLKEELEDETKPVPYIHVFAMLSHLKQICDHPCLINHKLSEYKRHHSGKWDLFVELLQETRESGQKLVVFSQYLDMLTLIENYLKEEQIGYATIRGSTRNRKEPLEQFRSDPKCEVFVASLQAAGVGIDLVAASVVIHYDRWWNPAKENQATDRVHRMGQSRGVQVFKMVTKDTVEEHIHRLIEKKKGLAEGIIGYDDQEEVKRFDRSEILQLLQQIDKDLKI